MEPELFSEIGPQPNRITFTVVPSRREFTKDVYHSIKEFIAKNKLRKQVDDLVIQKNLLGSPQINLKCSRSTARMISRIPGIKELVPA